MISIRCGGLRLVAVPEGGAPLRAALTVILETSQECGAVWWVQRSPRTRERDGCAEWRVGGPCARESCFRLGVLHVVRWSVRVQQHCGVGSCTAVAPLVWWCLPSAPLSAAGFTSVVFVTCLRGWSCGLALSLVSLLRVEFGRVDASVQPRIVVRLRALKSQPNRASFLFLSYDLPGS
jgi:hypothetical protein